MTCGFVTALCLLCVCVVHVSSFTSNEPTDQKSLGCFADRYPQRLNPQIGDFRRHSWPVTACRKLAQQKGYPGFAVAAQGVCFSSSNILSMNRYKKYGPSNLCSNGKGGRLAFNAYQIVKAAPKAAPAVVAPGARAKFLGCWADRGARAIPGKIGDFKARPNPIMDCSKLAKLKGFPGFAVQDGGQCFATKYILKTYKKYGPSRNCRNGKGGGWANNVYQF